MMETTGIDPVTGPPATGEALALLSEATKEAEPVVPIEAPAKAKRVRKPRASTGRPPGRPRKDADAREFTPANAQPPAAPQPAATGPVATGTPEMKPDGAIREIDAGAIAVWGTVLAITLPVLIRLAVKYFGVEKKWQPTDDRELDPVVHAGAVACAHYMPSIVSENSPLAAVGATAAEYAAPRIGDVKDLAAIAARHGE